jgi:hypothetical protein
MKVAKAAPRGIGPICDVTRRNVSHPFPLRGHADFRTSSGVPFSNIRARVGTPLRVDYAADSQFSLITHLDTAIG